MCLWRADFGRFWKNVCNKIVTYMLKGKFIAQVKYGSNLSTSNYEQLIGWKKLLLQLSHLNSINFKTAKLQLAWTRNKKYKNAKIKRAFLNYLTWAINLPFKMYVTILFQTIIQKRPTSARQRHIFTIELVLDT